MQTGKTNVQVFIATLFTIMNFIYSLIYVEFSCTIMEAHINTFTTTIITKQLHIFIHCMYLQIYKPDIKNIFQYLHNCYTCTLFELMT